MSVFGKLKMNLFGKFEFGEVNKSDAHELTDCQASQLAKNKSDDSVSEFVTFNKLTIFQF